MSNGTEEPPIAAEELSRLEAICKAAEGSTLDIVQMGSGHSGLAQISHTGDIKALSELIQESFNSMGRLVAEVRRLHALSSAVEWLEARPYWVDNSDGEGALVELLDDIHDGTKAERATLLEAIEAVREQVEPGG